VRLVEGISPRYLLSVRDISRDLFVYGNHASALTFMRGGVSRFQDLLPCPYVGPNLQLFACALVIPWLIIRLT
jgi:hypothetical protein